jgi:hypothetical protein
MLPNQKAHGEVQRAGRTENPVQYDIIFSEAGKNQAQTQPTGGGAIGGHEHIEKLIGVTSAEREQTKPAAKAFVGMAVFFNVVLPILLVAGIGLALS